MEVLLPGTPLALWYSLLGAIELCFAAGVVGTLLTNRMTLLFVTGFNVMIPVFAAYAWHGPVALTNARVLLGITMVLLYASRMSWVVAAWTSDTALSKLENATSPAEKILLVALMSHAVGLCYCLPFYYLCFDTELAEAAFPNASDVATIGLYVLGTAFHFGGDYQKRRFKQSPHNRGKVLNTGLWALSRHPNYFGDFLIYVSFATLVYTHPLAWLSPLLNIGQYFVDAIPKNERWASEKYGAQWTAYAASTPVFVPGLKL